MSCIHKIIFYQEKKKVLLAACFIFRAITIERLTSNFSQNAMISDALRNWTGFILIEIREHNEEFYQLPDVDTRLKRSG